MEYSGKVFLQRLVCWLVHPKSHKVWRLELLWQFLLVDLETNMQCISIHWGHDKMTGIVHILQTL